MQKFRTQNQAGHRISQIMGLLLGARIFVLIFYVFTLYISTFFLFNQEENLRKFVFDYKVHGIIFCSLLSIASGGIINQFYDLDKDKIQRPFQTRLQSFLKQKYFLYSYIFLMLLSLVVSAFLSYRIFLFFAVYQFFIWYYSHKLSKIIIVNNLSYVALSLYPFFGMLVYYQHFSKLIALMALFLFLSLLLIDILKDIFSQKADKLFGYNTIPVFFGMKKTIVYLSVLFGLNTIVSILLSINFPHYNYLKFYYLLSALVMIFGVLKQINFKFRNVFITMNLLRIWIFIGVVCMFLNGIFEKF